MRTRRKPEVSRLKMVMHSDGVTGDIMGSSHSASTADIMKRNQRAKNGSWRIAIKTKEIIISSNDIQQSPRHTW